MWGAPGAAEGGWHVLPRCDFRTVRLSLPRDSAVSCPELRHWL